MLYDIKSKTPKPKWYQFRHKLSNFFLMLAKKCYTENPEVYAFMVKQVVDSFITGKSVTHVDLSKYHEEV